MIVRLGEDKNYYNLIQIVKIEYVMVTNNFRVTFSNDELLFITRDEFKEIIKIMNNTGDKYEI